MPLRSARAPYSIAGHWLPQHPCAGRFNSGMEKFWQECELKF